MPVARNPNHSQLAAVYVRYRNEHRRRGDVHDGEAIRKWLRKAMKKYGLTKGGVGLLTADGAGPNKAALNGTNIPWVVCVDQNLQRCAPRGPAPSKAKKIKGGVLF